jgi:hypothetical protein
MKGKKTFGVLSLFQYGTGYQIAKIVLSKNTNVHFIYSMHSADVETWSTLLTISYASFGSFAVRSFLK